MKLSKANRKILRKVRRKLRKAILMIITNLAVILFLIGGLCLDSSPSLVPPFVMMGVSLAWLLLFYYVNCDMLL